AVAKAGRVGAVWVPARMAVANWWEVVMVIRRAAAPDAARLWPEHAEAGGRKARGDRVEIFGTAAERRQQDHQRSVALREDLDLRIAAADERASDGAGLAVPPWRAFGFCARRMRQTGTRAMSPHGPQPPRPAQASAMA